jgi:Mo-co oxidoreductase dimerisation domain/HD domain
MGLPMQHVLRQCFISMRLADRVKLDAADRGVVYYTALLAWVGCHVDAYEQAKWFGDDLALKGDFRQVDFTGSIAAGRFMFEHFGAGLPIGERAKLVAELVKSGWPRRLEAMERHCFAANELAGQLGLGDGVRRSLVQTFERWDGKGVPAGAKAGEILITARIVNLADVVEFFHRVGGLSAAIAVARQRSGTQFDPALVDVFCSTADELFTELDAVTTWDAVIGDEPGLTTWVSGPDFDAALEAIADFVDLKSPYTIGHSRAVAELAAAAAHDQGLPAHEIQLIRRAGLIHDLGRLGVSNAIWDKPGEPGSSPGHPFHGFYQSDRYVYERERDGRILHEPVRLQQVRALITEPTDGASVTAGDLVVRGVAWSGAAPIDRVDVSVAGGHWQPARLIGERRRHSWQWWELLTRCETRGATLVRARATDLAGRTQPERPEWNRLGYGANAIQQVEITVE